MQCWASFLNLNSCRSMLNLFEQILWGKLLLLIRKQMQIILLFHDTKFIADKKTGKDQFKQKLSQSQLDLQAADASGSRPVRWARQCHRPSRPSPSAAGLMMTSGSGSGPSVYLWAGSRNWPTGRIFLPSRAAARLMIDLHS